MSSKSASAILREIGTGINMGRVFESDDQSRQPTQVHLWLQSIKQKGFGHVRIPVTWYPGTSRDCRIDNVQFMQCLDDAIEFSIKIGLAVILNAHHEHWIFDHYDGSDVLDAKFKQLWTKIAQRYKKYPPQKLILEVLNEPTGKFDSGDSSKCIALTRQINTVGYEAIRAIDSTRIVLVQPNEMGNIFAVPKVYPTKSTLPGAGADKFLGVQCHSYDHYKFCLQVGRNDFYKNMNEMGADIQKRITMIKTWHASIGGPGVVGLHLGEFGVGRLDQRQRDTDIVKAYYRLTSKFFRDKGICTTVWSDGGWFEIASLDSSNKMQYPFGLADLVVKP